MLYHLNGGSDLAYLFLRSFSHINPHLYSVAFWVDKKGIALVLTVACLLSAFGIIAIEQFPLWQATLFLFLLVIASTYLLEQSSVIYFMHAFMSTILLSKMTEKMSERMNSRLLGKKRWKKIRKMSCNK